MRYFIMGVVVAIIVFFTFRISPEDMAAKKVEQEEKINNPKITTLPSIDGCEIKHIKVYARRIEQSLITPELRSHELYIAKCGSTQTTTNLEKHGKTTVAVPTIIDTSKK